MTPGMEYFISIRIGVRIFKGHFKWHGQDKYRTHPYETVSLHVPVEGAQCSLVMSKPFGVKDLVDALNGRLTLTVTA